MHGPPVIRLGAAALAVAVSLPGTAQARAGWEKLFTISDPRITESSGLAASHLHPGIVYTHNDSGHGPQVFAIGPDGRTRATYTIAGAGSRDWEAISLGRDDAGNPAIFIGDIGDNLDGAWPYVTVYRVPEPTSVRSQTLHATAFRFVYSDGPRNAESLLIDPRTNRLYIAEKTKLFSDKPGRLYEAPAHLRRTGTNTLHPVGSAPATATDGAWSPDGSTFVLRGYFGATLYTAPGTRLADVDLPFQNQGEGITYAADGRSLMVSSEGTDQPVYRVSLPPAALPKTTPTATATPASTSPGKNTGSGDHYGLLLGAGAVAAAIFFWRRRRS